MMSRPRRVTYWRWDRPWRWPILRWLFLLWWRYLEQEVRDVGAPETKGPPMYNRGKVSGLTPALVTMTETTESPWVCCGYCAAGMAVWTAKSGRSPLMTSTAHPIRAQGGRPHNNGARASELRAGAKAAHGVTLDALAVSEIREVLTDGYAVVVNLEYSKLASWLRVQGGSFGHSATMYGRKGDLYGFYDPLWPQGAAGAWVAWSDVSAALWGDGEHSGTVTRWGTAPDPPPDPEPEPPPPCPPAEQHTDAELRDMIAQGEAAGYRQALQDRDAAWRGTTGLSQPRPSGAWEPAGGSPDVLTRWSWFGRWGPIVEPETWNGAGATWDSSTWRE